MKTLALLFLTLPLWAGPPPQKKPPQRMPLDEMDSLADAFDINKPLAAMDTEDADMRPHHMDAPIVFRVPVTPKLRQSVARGAGSMQYPEVAKSDGKVVSNNSCAIDVLNSGGAVKDGFVEFELEVATWRIRDAPLYNKLANSTAPSRTCGAFTSVDTSGVFRVSCSIASCDATVRDFEKLFGSAGVELYTLVSDEDEAPASAPVVGQSSEFEKANHTVSPARPSGTPATEAPAAATGTPVVAPGPSAGAPALATSPSGASSAPPSKPEAIAPGGASLLIR